MSNEELQVMPKLKLNRETLRTLTHVDASRARQQPADGAPCPSLMSPCCTQRCVLDE